MKLSANLRNLHESCKSCNLLNLILVIIILLLVNSCAYKLSYKVKQSKIYQGDSVAVTWNVTHPGKIKCVSFGKTGDPLPLAGKAYFKPMKDTLIEFYVYQKGQQKPLKKIQRKINVLKPEIMGFSAIRDRFNNNKVMLNWSVKDYDAKDKTKTSIYIEGYYYNLAASDSITIPNFPQAATFTMVVKSPAGVVTKSCYVDGIITNQRPMIKKDTAIYKLPGNRKIFMKIIETNISDYPSNIKLKVIVYDSLGNFITHLAPPYTSVDSCAKFFQKLIDKADNVSAEPAFAVKEINGSAALYDLAVVLDYSGSMTPYMPFYKEATQKFIENKFPYDYYSVTKFDHRLARACPLLTSTKEILQKTGLKEHDTLGGSTALYAGIDCGLQTLANSAHKRVVMAFTDGYENSSFSYFGTYAWDINQMVTNIRKQNATLMLMGLGLTNTTLLNEMAYYSNGDYYYLSRPEDITDVYRDMQHNMRTYYEIAFKPLASETEHQVQLTYYNNKDTTTTTRPMYVGNDVKIDHDLKQFQIDTLVYWYDKELAKKGYKFITTPQSMSYFETNEEKINSKYDVQLKNLVRYLSDNPKTFVRIFGHTDTRGDSMFNCGLSKNRASSLGNYLIKKGISSTRVKFFGMGARYPINKNDNADWAAKENRRVEVVIWSK